MHVAPLDPGSVSIRLRLAAGRVAAVDVAATRPTLATALAGRPADRAVDMLPMLYAICGKAQGVAARLALAAARGADTAPRQDVEVLAEGRREHLWRLLLDWPRLLGLPVAEQLFAAGVARLRQPEFPAWAGEQLAAPLARLETTLATLPEPPATAATCLPLLDAAASLAAWPGLDAGFAAQPCYLGAAVETGAMARRAETEADESPVLARARARMRELRAPSALGQVGAAAVRPGVGRACVETARGLLMHELTLDGDRIADYVIVAPTEWNFHPQGILARWFDGTAAPTADALRATVERAVLALDPCVPCRVTLEEAE